MRTELQERWIKASIIGTIWAASEIVLGSFLHNLRIPFSGNFLTAIGIILLISISFTWKEKGLFWRAGLICAIMKTMSPSAVIFGPIIAIFAESVLLELSVRVSGRTFAGYIIGAMLAMSWNLFQKIANYIIFYGYDIVEVYTNLLKLAQKQLNIQTDIVWLPIIILLIIYSLFGLLAGVTGIRVGKKMLEQPDSDLKEMKSATLLSPAKVSDQKFDYSVSWLFINITLIVGSFFLLAYTNWLVWSLTITAIIIIWSIRYKRAMRQLSKPKFWIFFVSITLITAFVFTRAAEGENALIKGLLTGIQMNFRAVLIIVGFSALGTELYNPKIRSFFIRTSFKHLPLALELSAESLPSVISGIPDFKTFIKNPVSVFYQVVSMADKRLSEIKNKPVSVPKVYIICGDVGEGKTTFIKKMIDVFRKNGIPAGGIFSEREMSGTETTGYNIVDIDTSDTEIFLRTGEQGDTNKIGKYTINPSGLKKGIEILTSPTITEKKIVIIDEIGMLELNNGGWSQCLDSLVRHPGISLIITVREKFVSRIVQRWKIDDYRIFNVSENDCQVTAEYIISQVKK